MPAVPSSVLDPVWQQLAALLPARDVHHPLGCHRPRVDDRVVFDKLVQVLVLGCSYEAVADASCSARTPRGVALRRRRDEWIAAGVMERLRVTVLAQYDRLIGLELRDVSVDGCITKAPCGGEVAGRSPVDRGKQGLKRSMAVDARGVPLGAVVASANTHDSPLLAPTLDLLADLGPLPERVTVHLDRGYDSAKTRDELAGRGLVADVAERGKPAPVQAGRRWVVERTHAWVNNHRKLARCTERRRACVEFWLALAQTLIVTRTLLRLARDRYQ